PTPAERAGPQHAPASRAAVAGATSTRAARAPLGGSIAHVRAPGIVPERIPAERPPQPSTNRPPPPTAASSTTPAPRIPAVPPTPTRPTGTRRVPAPRRVRRPRGPAAVPDALPAGPPVRLPEPLSTCLPAARLRPARTAGRPPQPFRPTGSAHRCLHPRAATTGRHRRRGRLHTVARTHRSLHGTGNVRGQGTHPW